MQALGDCGVWLETLLDIFVLGLVDVGDSLAIQEQRSGCGLVSHLLKYVVVLLPSDPQPTQASFFLGKRLQMIIIVTFSKDQDGLNGQVAQSLLNFVFPTPQKERPGNEIQ